RWCGRRAGPGVRGTTSARWRRWPSSSPARRSATSPPPPSRSSAASASRWSTTSSCTSAGPSSCRSRGGTTATSRSSSPGRSSTRVNRQRLALDGGMTPRTPRCSAGGSELGVVPACDAHRVHLDAHTLVQHHLDGREHVVGVGADVALEQRLAHLEQAVTLLEDLGGADDLH